MKSKILAGAIALALMLTPTVASYASENINDKEVYLECDDCIKDNELRTKAKFASATIDKMLFEKWDSYNDIKEVIEDIINMIC